MADVNKVVSIKVESDIDKTTKDTKKLDKSLKGVDKASKQASKGVKAIGTAMKAAGIGLLVGAIAGLMAVFSKNQKVVDTMSTAMNTLQLGFNAVTGAISSAYTKVTEATNGFDALKKVILGVIKVAITPLKLAFYQIKSAIQVANVAYQTMFGDDESVKQAKKDLFETTEAIKQVGKDAIQSGKDIVNNFGEAVSEVGTGVKTLGSELKKIEPKKIIETAKGMTELSKNAESSAIALQGVIADLDRQAEKQRQIRDDERNSITVRKKANEDLKKILDERTKKSLALVDIEIANALAVDKANNNQESANALQEAYNKKKEVLAGIEGQISEQKANDLALDKDGLSIINDKLEADAALTTQKKKFAAEQIENDVQRLTRLREILDEEKEVELERLQNKRDSYEEGTADYVAAQIELNNRKQEFHEKEVESDKDIKTAKLISEEGYNKESVRIAKIAEAAKREIEQSRFTNLEKGLGLLKMLSGKNKAIQKGILIAESGLAIAKSVIETQAANVAIVAQGAALAIPSGGTSVGIAAGLVAKNNTSLGFGIAANLAATVKGLSALGGGSAGGGSSFGGGGSSFGSGSIPLPTSFDSISMQEQQEQREASALASQINDRPVQTYVTADDVASSRAYVDQRIDNTSF